MKNARGSDTLLSTSLHSFFDLLGRGNTKGEGGNTFQAFSALSVAAKTEK
jgi:hypothetical protein